MDKETVISYWRRLMENPSRLFRLFSSPCARGMFLHAFTEMDAYKFINNLTPIKVCTYKRLLSEIRTDKFFLKDLKNKYLSIRGVPLPQPQGWTELVYIIIRLYKPKIVVETGVFDGISSAFILKALRKNNFGCLFSIDKPARRKAIKGSTDLMPSDTLPSGADPGWLVPPPLRTRWKILITSKERGLKNLLNKVSEVDIFLHDSLHTKEHMAWEMKTVWPKIKKGGLLLVDDVFCNSAFKDFCRKVQRRPVYKFGLGAIRK